MCTTKVRPPSAEVHHPSILQTRGCCLCNPSHSGMGGMHWCHLDPLTETSRGGRSPTSPSIWKCYPRALQGLHRHLLRRGLHQPPPRKAWDHTIDLHPNAKLPTGRQPSPSPAQQTEPEEVLP